MKIRTVNVSLRELHDSKMIEMTIKMMIKMITRV